MSRSKRKNPIFGFTCAKSEKKDKQLANRKFRRITKENIRNFNFEEAPVYLKQIVSYWDFAKDGKHYWKKGEVYENGKYMRK